MWKELWLLLFYWEDYGLKKVTSQRIMSLLRTSIGQQLKASVETSLAISEIDKGISSKVVR